MKTEEQQITELIGQYLEKKFDLTGPLDSSSILSLLTSNGFKNKFVVETWVSIYDSLPEKDDSVLISYKSDGKTITSVGKILDDGSFQVGGQKIKSEYWMSFPEPPKD